jgi:hypothetical protein
LEISNLKSPTANLKFPTNNFQFKIMWDWQSWAVGLLIVAAAAYLLRRAFVRESACETGCGKCGDEPAPPAKRVVMVELQGLKRK